MQEKYYKTTWIYSLFNEIHIYFINYFVFEWVWYVSLILYHLVGVLNPEHITMYQLAVYVKTVWVVVELVRLCERHKKVKLFLLLGD